MDTLELLKTFGLPLGMAITAIVALWQERKVAAKKIEEAAKEHKLELEALRKEHRAQVEAFLAEERRLYAERQLLSERRGRDNAAVADQATRALEESTRVQRETVATFAAMEQQREQR